MRIATWTGLFLALLTAQCHPAQAWTPQRLGVDSDTLAAHVEGGWPYGDGPSRYCFWLEVGRDGKANPYSNQKQGGGRAIPPPPPFKYQASPQDYAKMKAAAAALRFTPFTWNGEAVTAVGNLCFPESAVRHEDWLEKPPVFPAVRRWQDVEIGLRRTPCLGSCPAYDVTISGTGRVRFSGSALSFLPGPERGVLVLGEHEVRIDPGKVQNLVEQFRQARFFALRDKYDSKIVDGSFTILWLTIDGHRKHVFDNRGDMVGLPSVFGQLVQAVEDAAGTDRWVRGNADTVPYMLAQGFNFASPGVLDVTRQAMRRGNGAVLAALAEQALPFEALEPALSLDYLAPVPTADLPLGQALVLTALRFDLPDLLARMQDRGWLDRTPVPLLQHTYDRSPRHHPDIEKAMISRGVKRSPPVAGKPAEPPAAEDNCPIYGHPLPSLRTGAAEEELLSCTLSLLAKGAKLDRVDATGYRYIDNAALASLKVTRRLLELGLQPRPPVETEMLNHLTVGHDQIILTLLEAGADPRGRDGTTDRLHGYAREIPLPATLEWLDAHGIE